MISFCNVLFRITLPSVHPYGSSLQSFMRVMLVFVPQADRGFVILPICPVLKILRTHDALFRFFHPQLSPFSPNSGSSVRETKKTCHFPQIADPLSDWLLGCPRSSRCATTSPLPPAPGIRASAKKEPEAPAPGSFNKPICLHLVRLHGLAQLLHGGAFAVHQHPGAVDLGRQPAQTEDGAAEDRQR